MPRRAPLFSFNDFRLDRATNTVVFSYVVELQDGTRETYDDILRFPSVDATAWDVIPPTLLEGLLFDLHLALGMSYWKMDVAPKMLVRSGDLSPGRAAFWNAVYTNGMGEFFYRNEIDFRGLVQFPVTDHVDQSTAFPRRDRSLVPIGGGKDSAVTVEMMKAAGKEFDVYTLGTSVPQERFAQAIGKTSLRVEHVVDAKMVERSKSGEVYNGHIPITAIYTFTGLLAAALGDYRYVVFSNERSSSEGNVEYLGRVVNHQWSKSLEFELLMHEHVRTRLTSDLEAFSLLRPLSELEIVRRFAAYPQFANVCTSCNRNFVISKTRPTSDAGRVYWCGECPKCAFVFGCLAAFVSKTDLVARFGKDLFADAALLPLYRELLGLEAFKPFECVGTAEEMKVAFARAQTCGEYAGEPIMQMFEERVLPGLDLVALERDVLAVGDISTIPSVFQSLYATR